MAVKLGNGNWAVKENKLLAYNDNSGRFFNKEFDFARGSSATYVGKDGLIKTSDLQSTNLVQNGNFSELSSELVTNGDFATDTAWAKGTGWSISGGSANCDGTQTAYSTIKQIGAAPINTNYKMVFTADITSGSILPSVGGSNGQGQISASGTYTFYTIASIGDNNLYFGASSDFIGSIDNVSVKEVDPNDNWTLGGSGSNTATIGSNSATITSVDGNSYIQQNSVLTSGKSYKISYEILSSSGSSVLKMISSLGLATVPTTVGTHTVYGTAISTTFYIERVANGINATITNISVQEIKTNTPRIDFSDSTKGALLLEPQSTNLFPYSSDLTSWTKIVSSVSYLENVINPSGETFASKITQTSSGGYVQLSRTFTGVETFSAFVKKSSSDFVRFYAGGNSVYFNILNGTIETISGSVEDKSITDFGNGWFRISITVNSTSSSSVRIYPASSGSSTSGLNSLFVYGTQLEVGSYATSYIPSLSGSATTRLADVCNNSGSAQDFNSEEGVLYIEAKVKTDTIFAANCIAISDGTDANRLSIIMYGNINSIRASMNVGGVSQFDFNLPSGYIQEQYYKIAVSYKVNDCKIFINGTKISTDTSATMPSLGTFDRLNLDLGQGLYDFYGKVKDIKLYNTALTDEFLAALTTI